MPFDRLSNEIDVIRKTESHWSKLICFLPISHVEMSESSRDTGGALARPRVRSVPSPGGGLEGGSRCSRSSRKGTLVTPAMMIV